MLESVTKESESLTEVLEMMRTMGHEQVVFCQDERTGLKAIIAIHNTVLGPSLGGTRMWAYKSEAEAIKDVLRLSRGMTYKSSISGLNLGGGKAVIIGDSRKDKSEALFRRFGQFVESLRHQLCEHGDRPCGWTTGIPGRFRRSFSCDCERRVHGDEGRSEVRFWDRIIER